MRENIARCVTDHIIAEATEIIEINIVFSVIPHDEITKQEKKYFYAQEAF